MPEEINLLMPNIKRVYRKLNLIALYEGQWMVNIKFKYAPKHNTNAILCLKKFQSR